MLIAGLLALAGFGLVTVSKPPAASADVPWPYQFQPHIDGYQGYQGQSTCDPTAKPGVIALRDHLNFWYGHHNSGIVRACGQGGQSEHKEGRALDYMINASDPKAFQIIAWLTATDEHGNHHAVGRRMGLMYIIVNRRIFRFYRPNEGWQPYTGSNPHTDHIHISFSWPGARKQTSWWTTTQQTRHGCGSTVETWTFATGFGPLVQVKKIKDYYGSTFDTQSEIRNSYWRVRAGGQQYFANQPMSVFANPRPQAVFPLFSGGQCLVNLY